ncbi:hypothetical protein [Caulobacter mirabilis]|uniref:Uncharacterized protein n=1 Tax=Caulobacter mirabilis TaxID=69666 RepID=A0A2D2B358_9CAUL|nr:hypothetical protein [Caulobacter mirabilis]ATQ44690.1 hypothetical protein CSW64_21020 [Caulobacter mirabilis]
MVHALSLAGDVFWILALALMASFTLAAWKRIPGDAKVPVLWKGMTATVRAPRAAALLTLPILAFAIGIWLKLESRGAGLDLENAVIGLLVRVTLAPLFALLHIGRVHKALAILDAEGGLGPAR